MLTPGCLQVTMQLLLACSAQQAAYPAEAGELLRKIVLSAAGSPQ